MNLGSRQHTGGGVISATKIKKDSTTLNRQKKSFQVFLSSFANDRLEVVAGDVVELDAVVVEVVQHRQAELVALAVVWLGQAKPVIGAVIIPKVGAIYKNYKC